MARVRAIEFPGVNTESLDQATRVNLQVGGILAQQPDMAAALGAFSEAVIHSGTLPRRLTELIRLRIAFHNQCRRCMAIRYLSDYFRNGDGRVLAPWGQDPPLVVP